MNISESTINRIRESVDIAGVIGEYVPLKKVGQSYKGLCPFHSEKTPSFIVNPKKGIFHCFGCGIGGNVFTFLMRFKGISFPDAVRMLGEKAGIRVEQARVDDREQRKREALYKVNEIAVSFFQKALFSEGGASAREYLKGRKIDKETAIHYKLGYAPSAWDSLLLHLDSKGYGHSLLEESGLVLKKKKGVGYYDRFRNRIMFPIQDSIGRYVGFGARILEGEEGPKYVNTNENELFHKGKNLFGFYHAEEWVRKEDAVFIVEGYFDVIRVCREGIRNTVAPLGTALTEDQVALLSRYTRNVYLAFDPDEAGKKAALRSIGLLNGRGIDPVILRFPSETDPGDFFDKYDRKDFDRLLEDAVPGVEYIVSSHIDVKKKYTANEKIVILQRLAEFYNGMESTILQDDLIRRISSALDTDEYILRNEIEKLTGTSKRTQKIPSFTENKRHARVTTEFNLLLFILSNPEHFSIVESRVDESYFQGRWTKQLYNALLKAKNTGSWDSGTVLGYIKDDKFVEYISGRLMEEVWNLNSKEAVIDLMKKLITRRIQDHIEVINKKLQKAVLENDEKVIGELNVEKQAQSNELKKWKELKTVNLS
ncbi:MAG: DNA primase [Spirochaetes bacterium]|nr:DNA primase [Spirochaetota bacterium]